LSEWVQKRFSASILLVASDLADVVPAVALTLFCGESLTMPSVREDIQVLVGSVGVVGGSKDGRNASAIDTRVVNESDGKRDVFGYFATVASGDEAEERLLSLFPPFVGIDAIVIGLLVC